MLYRTPVGTLKDNHVVWHDGRYYLFAMYQERVGDEEGFRNMWVATSPDGVHWTDAGPAIRDAPFRVWKMFVTRCGDRWVLNHGSYSGRPGTGQDTLCFWESSDLTHWRYLGKERDSHPDPRWYQEAERWDHMYVLPKEEGDPAAGYWGYVVATPRPGHPRSCGMMQSQDGIRWEALPPPAIEWDDLPPMDQFEVGGCERIGGRYYLIGGWPGYLGNWGYANYTLVGDSPTGPFRPDRDAFRLCGSSGQPGLMMAGLVHACFARGKGEVLLCTYMHTPWDGRFHMPPLKRAAVDAGGHLRPGYWPGNDAARGEAVPLDPGRSLLAYPAQEAAREQGAAVAVKDGRLTIRSGQAGLQDWQCVVLLEQGLSLGQGAILEGTLTVRHPERWRPTWAGFVLEEGPRAGTGIVMDVGHPRFRCTRIGRLSWADGLHLEAQDVTGPGCATATGLERDRPTRFRLWVRGRMLELYLEDILVQGFVTGEVTGRLGFAVQNGELTVSDLKAWRMSLPGG